MSSGAARRALAHLDGWTWLVAEYRVWLITLATVIGLAVPLLVAARKHLPRPAPSPGHSQWRHGTGVFCGHGDHLPAAARQRSTLAGTEPACDRPPERARRPLRFRQADHVCDQFDRGHPGRIPGNPGVSPHRYRLRVPGAGGPLLGGHNLAPCPSRRYQADRARRTTQVNQRVRAEIVIGCP